METYSDVCRDTEIKYPPETQKEARRVCVGVRSGLQAFELRVVCVADIDKSLGGDEGS